MASIRPMLRLLKVLTLEEEQAQNTLEAVVARLHQFESALAFAREREHLGRELVGMSIYNGDALDRMAALEEVAAAQRTAAALKPRIQQAEQEAAARREEFLAKRVERRQAETLLREAEAREAAEAARRAQQSTDDRYLSRQVQREERDRERSLESETSVET